MMKKILYIVFAMMFVFAACTEEIGLHEDMQDKDCITLKIFNSPMTKAADDDLSYESNLTRLDVFFYVEGQTNQNCVYYQSVTQSEYLTGAGEIPFYVVEDQINMIFPGGNETCDVFVIANLPDDMRTFDTDPAGGYADTEYNRLTSILLNLEDGDYDVRGKNFIMAGFDGNVRRDISTNNAEGTVKLIRAASKITVKVNIPAEIVLNENTSTEVTMIPVLEAEAENGEKYVPIFSSLHNGVKQGYLFPDGMIDTGMQVLPDNCYFETSKASYTKVKDIDVDGVPGVEKYQYECEVPFYSYPSFWQKGDEHQAYFSLEIPWQKKGESSYHPYYYQILINAVDRCLEPNHWYDMTVNVGVIGSLVEMAPVVLDDLSFYVLDWTTEPDPEDQVGGDRYEDLEIENYIYFSVPQKRIEMNNTTVGELKYEASHGVKWALEWPTDPDIQSTFDDLEITFNSSTKYYAYFIDCKPNKNDNKVPPASSSLANFISSSNFTLSSSGHSIVFNYPKSTITAKVFSPVYVHAKVWLDIDGQGSVPNDSEVNFVEYVTFVYYPPIYIEPELSVTQSVYVNGNRASRTATDNLIYINGTTYDLGGAYGQDDSKYMHTITVSSFIESDKFELDGESVSYIIGDPRVRESDLNLNNDSYDLVDHNDWAVDAAGRRLQYYYPTSTDIEVARIISPKFRISSKLGGYSEGDREGTTMRCASYQENGYPAGRWRVPTTAEVAFIAYLQSQDVILDLFVNKYYFSSSHLVKEGNDGADVTDMDSADHSVRCVYDEWYWGSGQDALVMPNRNPTQGDYYYFTWGDRQIWPEEN